MNLSDRVHRYAEIKAEMEALKAEKDSIEADILKAAEADLKDTKFKSVSYYDNNGNFVTATNSDTVKIIYPSMLKQIFGNPDLVNAEVERALLSAALGGEYVDEEMRISSNGRRTYKRTKKHIAPNANAALSYLQNKDKENWSTNPKADPELEDTSDIEEDVYGEEN